VTRGGVTLIELLVVVSILVLLAAVALPRMQPAMQERRLREAARAINVYLGSARTRAMETGRPVGVLLQRDELNANTCSVLHQVEIPPPYAGDQIGAVVSLQTGPAGLKMRLRVSDWSPGLVRRGDLIRLNHQGPLYMIYDDVSDNDPVDQPSHPDGTADPGLDFPCDQQTGFVDFTQYDPSQVVAKDGHLWIGDRWLSLKVQPSATYPWPAGEWSDPVPFQVFRQPSFDPSTSRSFKSMSAAKPLQLPRGVVVDLAASGTGDAAQFAASGPADRSPVTLMFSPSGAVERVCFQNVAGRVTSPVFLLVGKSARSISPGPEDGLANWQDLTNFWVAVGPQTGLVTVAEPYAAPGHVNAAGVSRPENPGGLLESRTFARQAQISKGGR